MELKKSYLGTRRWEEFSLENHQWFALLFFSFFLFAKISIVFHNLFCEILRKHFVKKKCCAATVDCDFRIHCSGSSSSTLLLFFFFSFPLVYFSYISFLFLTFRIIFFPSSLFLLFLSFYLLIFSPFYFLIFLSISSHFLIFLFSHLFM